VKGRGIPKEATARAGGMSVATLLRTATGSGVPAFRPARLPGLATAKEWAEGGRLTLAAVAAAHRGAMTVKRSPDPHFMYTEVGVPDRLPDDAVTGVGARTEFVDMEPAEFVRACEKQDGSTPPFHYYTCGVLQHAPDFAEKASRNADVDTLHWPDEAEVVDMSTPRPWPRRVLGGSILLRKSAHLHTATRRLPTPRYGWAVEAPPRKRTTTYSTMCLCRQEPPIRLHHVRMA
jgi:hypothetical protein